MLFRSTELGEDRGRIHLHGIFFGNQAAELVMEKWRYGYVFIGNFVNEKTINYISKYMLKDDLNNREFTGKVLTSAGMGKQYFERGDWKFNKYNGKSLKHWCVTELGEDRGRIHLHGIFFGNQAAELVIEKWRYGYVFIGNFVNEKTINYIKIGRAHV